MGVMRGILLSGVAALVLPQTAAMAEGNGAPGASGSGNAPAADAAASSSEIVVTANKRTESANKVGLTMTVLSGTQLAERKITSLADIAAAVPGLTFATSTANTPIFTLRGVGFNESSLGVYPAVSVYLDQQALPFPVLASHSAYDLERIEVLKGPQGTLFGQNSTGGAINYIAAKPTKTLQAGGDISYGRFNEVGGNAYVSGPITDRLGFRLSANGDHMDGWQYSVTRPGDRNASQSYMAGRLLLDWKPIDAARFELNVNGFRDNSQPQAQQLVMVNPQKYTPGPGGNAGILTTELAQGFSNQNARSADWVDLALDPNTVTSDGGGNIDPTKRTLTSFRPYSNRKMYQIALRGDIDVLPGVTLTSLTSYNHFTQSQTTNGDGMAIVTFDLQRGNGYIHNFNQELRLANTGNSALKWVIGGNYEKTTSFEDQLLRYFDNSNYAASNLFINASGVTNQQSIRNLAAFGNVEYQVFDKLKLKAAVRYTDSRNNANECSYTLANGNVDKLFNLLGSAYAGGTFTPITPTGCYTLNLLTVPVPNGVTLNTPAVPGASLVPGVPLIGSGARPGLPFVATLHEHNTSWKIGADYQIDPRTLVYANVSRGYKAGSFPSLAAAIFNGLLPVTQESVTAYEAGLKAQMFDRKVQLNAAGFYYDYKNKQVRGKLFDPIFGDLDALVNVPKSRIWGLEGDLTVRPAEGLTIGGSVTYLNSKVLNYTGIDVLARQNVNFAGDPLPFTPKWSGQINVDYRAQLANGGTPFFGLTVHAQTDSDAVFGAHGMTPAVILAASPTAAGGFAPTFAPGVKLPFVNNGYATLDLRLGYEAAAGWRVELWGKNVTNKYYWTNVVPANDSAARLAGMPATYGVTFGFTFK